MIAVNGVKNSFRFLSILACIVVSGVVTWLFYVAAINIGAEHSQYTQVDTFAGMGFVFILSMIVSISLVPPLMRKLLGRYTSGH